MGYCTHRVGIMAEQTGSRNVELRVNAVVQHGKNAALESPRVDSYVSQPAAEHQLHPAISLCGNIIRDHRLYAVTKILKASLTDY